MSLDSSRVLPSPRSNRGSPRPNREEILATLQKKGGEISPLMLWMIGICLPAWMFQVGDRLAHPTPRTNAQKWDWRMPVVKEPSSATAGFG